MFNREPAWSTKGHKTGLASRTWQAQSLCQACCQGHGQLHIGGLAHRDGICLTATRVRSNQMQQGTLINLGIGGFTHSTPVFDLHLIKQNWIREIVWWYGCYGGVNFWWNFSETKCKVHWGFPFLFMLACTRKNMNNSTVICRISTRQSPWFSIVQILPLQWTLEWRFNISSRFICRTYALVGTTLT